MLFAISIVFLIAVQDGSSLKEGDPCVVRHTRAAGVCRPASSCQSIKEDFQIQGIRPTFCSQNIDTKPVVCCSDSSVANTAPSVKSRSVSERNSDVLANNIRLSDRKCEEYSQLVTSDPKCNYTGDELVVGGQNASLGEYPHAAALGWVGVDGNYVFYCGGSLISSRFVLTAGHCTRVPYKLLKNPAPQIVRLGDQNLNPSVRDNASPIDVPIKTIHVHPGYKTPRKYNDIALVELDGDVDFKDAIRPACLWTKPNFPGNSKAIATGWGFVDPKRPTKISDELQKVAMTLLENDFCNETMEGSFSRLSAGVSEGQLCATEQGGGQNACQVTGGAPLQVASRSNKCIHHVIGITSFGRSCAKSDKPAVYTRVSSYLDWIEALVWPREQ